MSPPPDPSPLAGAQNALEVDNYVETYKVIADWIRFADTKAGVTLTVNGVLLGLLIPTLKSYLTDNTITHPFGGWTTLVITLFVIWIVLLVVSAANSFLCILPLRGLGRGLVLSHASHFHPASVSQHYPLTDLDRFVNDCDTVGMAGLKREIIAAILIDSHLSSAKYRYVSRAISLLAGSVVFGFLYLVAIQL